MSDPPAVHRLSLLRRIAYGLVPVLVLVGGAEIAVRAIDPAPPPALLAAPLERAFDQRPERLFRRHDRLFWELRPNLDEPLTRYGDRTDALGLRNLSTPGPKAPGRIRVACMGDSCTYGLGVAIGDAWPQQLGRDAAFDAVNAGVPGYSSYQGVALWDDRVGALDPDVVVVEYGLNDVAPWPTPDGDSWAFLTDRDRAPHVAFSARPWGSALVGWLAGKFALRQPDRIPRSATLAEMAHATPRVPPGEFRENVATLAGRAPRAVVVAWPYRARLEADAAHAAAADPSAQPGMTRMSEYREILRDVAARGGHAFVDVESVFRASGLAPAELFVDDVHASPAGLALVAGAVSKAIGGTGGRR